MDELLAWVVFPLVALVVCMGIGLLAERIAGVELHPALVPGLGFAGAIVLLGPLFATGAGEWPGFVLLVVAAVAGFVLSVQRLADLGPGPGALAGAATYALHLAPVALSGTATFLGYNLLNDTAIHLALVDWIGDHGTRWIAQPPSSYASAIHDYVGSHYPLGSHELLAALRPVVDRDPSLLYQPFLALSAALGTAAIYALLRDEQHRSLRFGAPDPSRMPAALAAFAALASQLVFSFALQGGIKEITFITCLAAAAALGARAETAVLMALPAAALYAIYGVYSLPWIAPLALVTVLLARPGRRVVVAGVVVFVLAIAVDIPGSISYYRHGHNVITSGTELGPLAGPLKPVQAAGIWLTGDYRFTPASHAWVTYVLIGFALALAVAGVVAAVRRRSPGPLLLMVPAFVAWAVTSPASSPYIDAKLLAVLSPAVVLAACLGIAMLRPRRLAVAAAAVLGGALLVSDAYAYRVAMLAPTDRLGELTAIDKRFAGQGPVLVNEFEEYVKHYMRHSRGSEPYESWTAGRAQLRDPRLPVAAHAYDLDQMTTAFIERWPLIALRRSPAESRPPSNYALAWRGRFYEVWRRNGPAPALHRPYGAPPFSAVSTPSCRAIRALGAKRRLVAAWQPAPVLYDIARQTTLPPGWYRDAVDPTVLVTTKGGTVDATGPSRSLFPGTVWLRGRSFRKDEISIDGKRVGIARHLNGPNQWIEAGPAPKSLARTHKVELDRPTRSLRPGDAGADHIGPIAITQGRDERLISSSPGHAARLCNRPLDWIDVR